MSYRIFAYFTDEDIERTSITVGGEHITRVCGDEDIEIPECESEAIFEAEATEGCMFRRWIYQIGSKSAATQYSTDNPFVYHGSEDIYIRADAVFWTSKSGKKQKITEKTTYSIGTLNEYTVYVLPIYFNVNGEMDVLAPNNIECYLSTSRNYGYGNGIPVEYIASGAGELSCEIKKSETYYLFVREADGKETRNLRIEIYPPTGEIDPTIDGVEAYIYIGSSWIQATPYIYDGSKWVKYTPQIYSNGWK